MTYCPPRSSPVVPSMGSSVQKARTGCPATAIDPFQHTIGPGTGIHLRDEIDDACVQPGCVRRPQCRGVLLRDQRIIGKVARETRADQRLYPEVDDRDWRGIGFRERTRGSLALDRSGQLHGLGDGLDRQGRLSSEVDRH